MSLGLNAGGILNPVKIVRLSRIGYEPSGVSLCF
jgi:hypothetical protein